MRLLKRAMLGAAPAEELEAEARGELAEGEEPEAEAGGAPAAAATEQRETETRRSTSWRPSRSAFRVLFESVTEGVALYEPVVREGGAADYRILQANRSFLRQTGLRANGARGRLASEVFGPEPPPRLEEYAEVAGGAAPEVFERVAPATGRSLRLTALPLGAAFCDRLRRRHRAQARRRGARPRRHGARGRRRGAAAPARHHPLSGRHRPLAG